MPSKVTEERLSCVVRENFITVAHVTRALKQVWRTRAVIPGGTVLKGGRCAGVETLGGIVLGCGGGGVDPGEMWASLHISLRNLGWRCRWGWGGIRLLIWDFHDQNQPFRKIPDEGM